MKNVIQKILVKNVYHSMFGLEISMNQVVKSAQKITAKIVKMALILAKNVLVSII